MTKKVKKTAKSQAPSFDKNINVYKELSSLPEDVADQITNAKTMGGRSLDAIWALKGILSTQKFVLLNIAKRLTFSINKFANQYQFVSLSEIADEVLLSESSVSRALNGYKDSKNPEKNYLGLIELGYVKKISASTAEQIELNIPNAYCLTPKVFNEYILVMIEDHKNSRKTARKKLLQNYNSKLLNENGDNENNPNKSTKEAKAPSPHSDNTPPPTVTYFFRNDSVRSSVNNSLDVAETKKSTSSKNFKNKKKISFATCSTSWTEAPYIQKLDILLHMAIDSHALSAKQKMCKPLDFNNFPMLLKPFFEGYSLDLIYEFYKCGIENNAPIDVRKTEAYFMEWKKRMETSQELVQEDPQVIMQTEEVPLEPRKLQLVNTKEKICNIFDDLSEDVKTFVKQSSKHQKKLYKIEIETNGKEYFERAILQILSKNKSYNRNMKFN